MHRNICVFLLSLSLLATQISAATSNSVVVERLAAGERIEAALSNGNRLKGTVDHVTPASLFVERKGKATEVKRADVARLYLRKPGAAAKWTIIGAAVGAGAGGALGGAILERESGFGGAMAGTVGFLGAIGAGVGYLIGHRKSVLIYTAPSRAN